MGLDCCSSVSVWGRKSKGCKWKGQLLLHFCKVLVTFFRGDTFKALPWNPCAMQGVYLNQTHRTEGLEICFCFARNVRTFFFFSTKFCDKSFSCDISQLQFCEIHHLLHAWLSGL